MAHTYNVTSFTNNGTTSIVAGTVDGQSVYVTFPSQVFASTLAFQAFVQTLMMNAAALPDATKLGSFIA